MPHPHPPRLLHFTGLILALFAAYTIASPLQIDSVTLLKRATAGENHDTNGLTNGGAASAANSAHAAGKSIDTGSGGARGTPETPGEFAQLLSGFFFPGQ